MTFSQRRLVMSQTVSEEEYERVTAAQKEYLLPLLIANMEGHEKNGLDYGCGSGRFTPMLREAMGHHGIMIPANVLGYDINQDMIDAGPSHVALTSSIITVLKHAPYDLVFLFLVLGGISDHWAPGLAATLSKLLKPNGLLFIGEHTVKLRENTYWRFRPMQFYTDLFARAGIPLRRIGECMQLENSVTIMAGRRA